MNDEHINVIDMYDVNAKQDEAEGKPPYKAYEIDLTKDQQRNMRVYHGTEEGETLISYTLITKVKQRTLVRILVDERLPDALAQGEAEFVPLREQIKQEAMMEINALETKITSLSLLEQLEMIQGEVGFLEQLLIFDTNTIHILEGRHLDQLMEPIQDAKIRNLYCFNEEDEPPQNGEPIIMRVSEYEFGNDDGVGQADSA